MDTPSTFLDELDKVLDIAFTDTMNEDLGRTVTRLETFENKLDSMNPRKMVDASIVETPNAISVTVGSSSIRLPKKKGKAGPKGKAERPKKDIDKRVSRSIWAQPGKSLELWENMAESMEGELGEILANRPYKEWPRWVRDLEPWIQTRMHDVAVDLQLEEEPGDELPATPYRGVRLAPDSPLILAPDTPRELSPIDVFGTIPETPQRPRGYMK